MDNYTSNSTLPTSNYSSTNTTTSDPGIKSSPPPNLKPRIIAGSVCAAVALVIIVVTAFLCFRRYRRKRSRPRLPLPSLEDCDARHSVNSTRGTSQPTGNNVERNLGHESNAENAHQDAELYENTVHRKKTPNPPASSNTHGYYIVPSNRGEKPPVKPKPRPNLSPPGNGCAARSCQPRGVTSPEQPCYLEVLPDGTGNELQQYSYVPTHWPPEGVKSKQAPLDRQTSDSSMNYYNMPSEASYQNVKTKLQS